MVWYVVQIFYAEGMRLGFLTWLVNLLGLLAPVGLASFALSVWRSPPRRNSPREKVMGKALWFALFFALEQFVVFQDREDCEISSSMPGCCSFPDWLLTAYNKHEHLDVKCNKALRCDQEPPKGKLNCTMPEEVPEFGGLGRRLTIERFTKERCIELDDMWNKFKEDETAGLEVEVRLEEQGEAPAYRLFNTVGQAATVEMCFTIIGVLMKVIFLTRHPNSERILDLDQHHHVSDHHGQNRVVTVSRTARARWSTVQTAVRSRNLLARAAAASTEMRTEQQDQQ